MFKTLKLHKLKLNGLIKKQQFVRFIGIGFGLIVMLALILIASKSSSNSTKKQKVALDFTGVMDSQFSEADTESAMTSQQLEVDGLKKQLASLSEGIKTLQAQSETQVAKLTEKMVAEIARIKIETEKKTEEQANKNPIFAANDTFNPNQTATDGFYPSVAHSSRLNKPPRIHSVSFQASKYKSRQILKNPTNYVPSGTFAKAVVLGGVDADASVDGQNKNNGVMLFKIINQGTLPNGKRSHLEGCFVTASAYGDISSERAYVKLDKISCSFEKGMVDKEVTGWAFFAGKVGIKGIPLMRDGKVVTWAGISGALSGVAQAAQYAQSVQSFGALGGVSSVVPSSHIGPFAAYGGASKAADQLSQYYIKRAEQYHPVIQVGSGNVVNIVFKDGFYFYDEPESKLTHYQPTENNEPIVPNEVLSQLNQAQLGQQLATPGASR